MTELTAIGVSPGYGSGRAYVIKKRDIEIPVEPVSDAAQEVDRFHSAYKRIIEETRDMLATARKSSYRFKAEILDAYLALLEDTAIIEGVGELIENHHYNAAMAANRAIGDIVEVFERMEDDYMRERAYDVRDIQTRLVHELLGVKPGESGLVPPGSIVVADDLTTSDTARMELENVAGIVTARGGRHSHTSIVARSMEIPAVIGAEKIIESIRSGDEMLVDGCTGEIYVHPTREISEDFVQRELKYMQEREYLKNFIGRPSVTMDGVAATVLANIATPSELPKVSESDAEGIGLFRSEFLFTDRARFPSEQIQFEAYRNAAFSMRGKPVIIRTMDLGGDKKFLPSQNGSEENPAMGYRAIRIHVDRPDFFKTQLRAILRASYFGNVKINLPMIISLDEIMFARAALEEAKAELRREGVSFDENIELGCMVETPAAVMISSHLAKECDFFAIGTNDLVQYTLAVDRGNARVFHLYSHYHPAVMKLIAHTIAVAGEAGIVCGVCGESAGDPLMVPALLGMGLRGFSTNAGQVLRVRGVLAKVSLPDARALAREVLTLPTANEVQAVLEEFSKTRVKYPAYY
jgi:phosphotransferase system enzyme I (PtsI)